MRFQWIRGAWAVFLIAALCLIPGAVHAQAISEVTVIYSQDPGVQPPAGFTEIPRTLSVSTVSNPAYVYACYRRGAGAPITGLYVTGGDPPPVDEQCTEVPVNLNWGNIGNPVYLWYTKDPGCGAIDDLIVLYGNEEVPAGYTKIDYNVNGVSGPPIYFCYRKR